MTRHLRFVLVLLLGGSAQFLPSDANAWDPVRDITGRTLKQHTERAVKRTGKSWEKLLKDPVGYTFKLPFKVFQEVCGAPARAIGYTYEGQARGKWQRLPAQLIQNIQPYYSTNLKNVRFAENIRIVGAPAITFGNLIYFNREIDFNDDADLWEVLHELEHTVHYQDANDVHKLCEYTMKAISHGGRHDSIDWEKAADRKANFVMARLFEIWRDQEEPLADNEVYLENLTPFPVVFFLHAPGERWERHVIRPDEWIIFTGPRTTTRNFDIDYEYAGGVDMIRLDSPGYYQFDMNRLGELELFPFQETGELP